MNAVYQASQDNWVILFRNFKLTNDDDDNDCAKKFDKEIGTYLMCSTHKYTEAQECSNILPSFLIKFKSNLFVTLFIHFTTSTQIAPENGEF